MLSKEDEQKLKDLKDLEERTRNTLIDTQIKIKELEKDNCTHGVLSDYDGLQYYYTHCDKLFLASPSLF